MLLVLNECVLLMLEDSNGHLPQVQEKEEWLRRAHSERTIWICQGWFWETREEVVAKFSSPNLIFLEFFPETREE